MLHPTDPRFLEEVARWRRHLHAHPELSGEEAQTAAFVSRKLTEMGIAHETGIGGHGIVARLHRPGSNRSVGLRGDMDALPIVEANDFDHMSTRHGVMHACGHDGHTAALLGVAAVLNAAEDWQGTIHLIFQPAEENGTGAKAMIADGLFDRYPTERLFGWHNIPGWDAGTAAIHVGPSMAAGGDWRVSYNGVAGHAAAPHLTRDPITAIGHLIVALNSIVPRNVDPADTVVITSSMVRGGVVSNQIPDSAELVGTLRTFNEDVRRAVIARMGEVIEGTAATFGVKADYLINSTGKVICDTPEDSDLAVEAARAAGLSVSRDIKPFMGGDDFAFLVETRPGAYIHIGNGPVVGEGKLHNAGYDFNDEVLGPAISWLANVAKLALKAGRT
ncbi:amidohydrolase [Shimia sp.]|uniref:amidohydrolase n=1 Tax=Shimia sp. TaxID=1954381 RepID=UPI003B8AD782